MSQEHMTAGELAEAWLKGLHDHRETVGEVAILQNKLAAASEKTNNLTRAAGREHASYLEQKARGDRYAEALRGIKGVLIKEDKTRAKPINAVFHPMEAVCTVCECSPCTPDCAKKQAEDELK